MGKRYICEVKRDHNNNELELVNTKNFDTIQSSGSEGVIKFSDNDEMNRYFNRYCISEDDLSNNGSGLFMFLFFLLLLIFIITLTCQAFTKPGNAPTTSTGTTSSFGRFSF